MESHDLGIILRREIAGVSCICLKHLKSRAHNRPLPLRNSLLSQICDCVNCNQHLSPIWTLFGISWNHSLINLALRYLTKTGSIKCFNYIQLRCSNNGWLAFETKTINFHLGFSMFFRISHKWLFLVACSCLLNITEIFMSISGDFRWDLPINSCLGQAWSHHQGGNLTCSGPDIRDDMDERRCKVSQKGCGCPVVQWPGFDDLWCKSPHFGKANRYGRIDVWQEFLWFPVTLRLNQADGKDGTSNSQDGWYFTWMIPRLITTNGCAGWSWPNAQLWEAIGFYFGWWFGTWHHPNWLSYFSEGLQPPNICDGTLMVPHILQLFEPGSASYLQAVESTSRATLFQQEQATMKRGAAFIHWPTFYHVLDRQKRLSTFFDAFLMSNPGCVGTDQT